MEDYKLVKVHAGKGKFVDAKVSLEDYKWISQWKGWTLNSSGYPRRTIRISKTKYGTVFMHRLIINAPDGIEVDHINRDKLDDRRSNLRLVTRSENAHNTVRKNKNGYMGVQRHGNKFRADVHVGGKHKYIGLFDTPLEAGIAVCNYKNKHFGSALTVR